MNDYARIDLLLQQQKYGLAEKQTKQLLVEQPNDGILHSLLALSYRGMNKIKESLDSAKNGVGLSPDEAYTFYVLAICYTEEDEYFKAMEAILNALAIEPEDEDYLVQYAAILLGLEKYNKAISTVNNVLRINPQHSKAKRIKSIILRIQGKFKESDVLVDEALKENPEDSDTFANKGLSSLDAGNVKESLEHFKIALLLDPTSEFAKSGLVMSLKAQNFLFNLFYKYYNWISHLSSRVRWALMVGLILLIKVGGRYSQTDPTVNTVFSVFMGAYICFVFMAWTISPILNILLRFNRYGKYALNKGEIIGSNVILVLIGSAIFLLIANLIIEGFPITGALGALLLCLPFAASFYMWGTKLFYINLIISLAMTLLWLLSIIVPLVVTDYGRNDFWYGLLVSVVVYTLFVHIRT